MNFTFKGVEKQAKEKGLILERFNKKYLLWHPKFNDFGESECSNLNECMSEIISFNVSNFKRNPSDSVDLIVD